MRQPGTDGEPALQWHDGDDFYNLMQLYEVAGKNVLDAVPELANARYNIEAKRFEDDNDKELARTAFDDIAAASEGARQAGAGGSTLARAVFFRSLVQRVVQAERSGVRDGVLESLGGGSGSERLSFKGAPVEGAFYQKSQKSVAPTFDAAVPAEEGYVYHATNTERFFEIEDAGELGVFAPDYGTDQAVAVWPDGSGEDRAYFGKSPKAVAPFAPEDGKPVLLRVEKTSAEIRQERGTGNLYATEPIPANELEYLGEDGAWHKIALNSLKQTNRGEY